MNSIDQLKQQLSSIFKEYSLDKAAVFGSYARGEAKDSSDLDLLISSEKTFDLETYSEFVEALERITAKKIDIVFYDYLNPYMKDNILKEAISIYEQ